jgi:hypothetical protein
MFVSDLPQHLSDVAFVRLDRLVEGSMSGAAQALLLKSLLDTWKTGSHTDGKQCSRAHGGEAKGVWVATGITLSVCVV